MDQLPQNLLDHMRGYLRCGEIHRLRCVSKSWEKISNVQKSINIPAGIVDAIKGHFYPAHAKFQNATCANITKLKPCYQQQHGDKQLYLLQKLFAESMRSLENLNLYMRIPDKIWIPELVNLRYLNVGGNCLTSDLLAKVPNVEQIALRNSPGLSIDLAKVPQLKILLISTTVGVHLTNVSSFNNSGRVLAIMPYSENCYSHNDTNLNFVCDHLSQMPRLQVFYHPTPAFLLVFGVGKILLACESATINQPHYNRSENIKVIENVLKRVLQSRFVPVDVDRTMNSEEKKECATILMAIWPSKETFKKYL